uniref:Neurotransmitter-gated ion-channel ligand-binding domain-containing protein n=1 Tax=Plectus sambesii TaxID=2011161 RepID=A0A914W3A3_9BILA
MFFGAFAVESSDVGARFGGYDERGETQEQKLLYHLLKHYERAVRPVRNASHTITVKLGLTLTNIFDMDEKNQVLTINVWLDQVLNFHHRGPFHKEIPYWIRWLILDKLRRFLCMKLPYTNFREAAQQPKQTNNSLMRRMSLKLTIDNLQDELLHEMGLERRMSYCESRLTRSGQGNCVGRETTFANMGEPETIALSRTARPTSAGSSWARSQLHEEVLKTLQVLISRQELDDECEEIANEWRQVAQVIDRLLFWVFLLATVVITLVLLIIIPLVMHAMETNDLDERLFGLH